MQSYECVIISKMFLIYFISYGCNDSALVFLGGAEASASPSFALPMFITIKKIIILHLFLGVPAATVGGTGTPWHTRGYAPALYCTENSPSCTAPCYWDTHDKSLKQWWLGLQNSGNFQDWKLSMGINRNIWELTGNLQNCRNWELKCS